MPQIGIQGQRFSTILINMISSIGIGDSRPICRCKRIIIDGTISVTDIKIIPRHLVFGSEV